MIVTIPVYDGGPDRGTRTDRRDYLEPMAERWPRREGGRMATAGPANIARLVQWLDVAQSKRWQPRPRDGRQDATYCDHYAADLLEQLYGRQLISAWVWWTAAAIARIRAGEVVPVVYGDTVIEHGASGLYHWLARHGGEFFWVRHATADALRARLNVTSAVGLIVTAAHVAVALPDECEGRGRLAVDYASGRAGRALDDGKGELLQTQAGTRCIAAWRRRWWGVSSEVRFYSFEGSHEQSIY